MTEKSAPGRLSYRTLVVLQPTTFCNIDCSYCYLTERGIGARMSLEVQRAAFDSVLSSELVEDPVVFLWHLGEPLSVPPRFYETAFAIAAETADRYGRTISHGFQTNATLMSDRWIELIRRHQVRVGVSVDGPAFIHDRVRVDRKGRGTHADVMRGIGLLQDAGIGFGAISVLTDFTLDHPEAYYDFFVEAGIGDVGYNIDEVEGANTVSSFGPESSTRRYERFLERLLDRAAHHHGAVKIREVWTNMAALAFGGSDPVNNTNAPFRIINIDHKGGATTFCPELLTSDHTMGNVLDGPIDRMLADPVFERVGAEIAAGVRLCKETCEYWRFCGGGSPSNKFFEHGRFDVAETRTCRVHKKATVDVLLRHLERRAGLGVAE
ncbi:cyclophane-forming radical SAM/SPASM peptide maturase GrrM/OscB [Actinomadura algeriensis]|uniref:Radical SAM core domain-containing protein n=1 Tax=Actinomadura algeriensis TaxID=1679523 RepID=A0ABR9JRK6_9ACTN|nr:cyclophane-forming radical SAM/SPASM peptide maturase GrrM/OscB [Actinomadura algeriensis]MBE1533162.1 uncharacterized protein [Actinomadura algeriensis]